MTPFALGFYARLCGWTLARAHARSGDAVALAEYLGPDDSFDQAITDFSERYADQNEQRLPGLYRCREIRPNRSRPGRLTAARQSRHSPRPNPNHSTKGAAMTESIDELGPVDYLVVEFPGSNFTGEILPELASLVERGIVRVLDLVLIKKEEDGSFEAFEFDDVEAGLLGDVRELERDFAELLSEDDVAAVVEALEPGSTAGLLVYENLWAAPFASAVRRSGGQLVASGRIPVQALLGALEQEIEQEIEDEIEQEIEQEVLDEIEQESDAGTSSDSKQGA